jgi:hypothetical protein
MKIFPEKDCSIELNQNSSLAISELKNQTLSEEQYVVNWNNQSFIGKFEKNEFQIKLSKKILGKFCILNGKLENKKGILKIQTSKRLKIIFTVIIIFMFFGIISALIQNDLKVVFGLILNILVMRYILLELGFRIASKKGIKKLTEIIGIKKRNNKL